MLNTVNCIHGQKQIVTSLLAFSVSALMACILPHCRLRDWCGNLRNDGGHVVCRLDQSASFRIFDSTFYFPHSAVPHFTHCLLCPIRISGGWPCSNSRQPTGFTKHLTGPKYSSFLYEKRQNRHVAIGNWSLVRPWMFRLT